MTFYSCPILGFLTLLSLILVHHHQVHAKTNKTMLKQFNQDIYEIDESIADLLSSYPHDAFPEPLSAEEIVQGVQLSLRSTAEPNSRQKEIWDLVKRFNDFRTSPLWER